MQFWRLDSPDYASDYQDSYINGSLEHKYGMPGIRCDACEATWSGSRVLPITCPTSVRTHKKLTDPWPISLVEHRSLQTLVHEEIRKSGQNVLDIRPGDDFQPCYLDVPSKPTADFLWSSIGSVVVSERTRAFFNANKIDDVEFCPVNLRKVGKRGARLPTPIPDSGEPEDLIKEAKLLKNTDFVGPYYEMVILKESGYSPNDEPISICSGCNRKSFDRSNRKILMVDSMWQGEDIFFLASSLYIMITDELKEELSKLRPTNVVFTLF